MSKIQKATLGISFSLPMYRIGTLGGQLADELLKLRGIDIPVENFEKIGLDKQNSTLSLFNKEKGVFFTITLTDITYTFDHYDSDAVFSFDMLLKEFEAIWKTCETIIKFPTIRRIGFVTEHRIKMGSESNNILLDKFTKLKPNGFPARFNLTFDDRINTGHGGLPDFAKDDFINIIRNYYDSSLDATHPKTDSVNANLDVQRYFSPALMGVPFDEIKKLKKEYEKAAIQFNSDLESMESKHAKPA